MGDILTGLEGHYKLDSSSGLIAYDSSGNGLDGDLVNFVGDEWTAGKINNALEFVDTNDEVDLGNNFSFEYNDSFSYSAWFKLDNSRGGILYGKWNNVSRGYSTGFQTANGYMSIYLSSNSSNRIIVQYQTDLRDSTWHHAVITYNGNGLASGIILYIDSDPVSLYVVQNNLGALTIVHTYPALIGNSPASLAPSGKYDDVRIYSRELTQDDVDKLFAWREGGAGRLVNYRSRIKTLAGGFLAGV